MNGLLIGAVLFAAVLHAGWNAMRNGSPIGWWHRR
jgi:hypothetical protein